MFKWYLYSVRMFYGYDVFLGHQNYCNSVLRVLMGLKKKIMEVASFQSCLKKRSSRQGQGKVKVKSTQGKWERQGKINARIR